MRQIFYTLVFIFSGATGALAQAGLDASFGTAGTVTSNFGFGATNDVSHAMVIQPDGKILVGGLSASKMALARYNSDGTLDNSFGTAGKLAMQLIPNSSGESVTDLILLADGKILVAGRVTVNATQGSFVAKFLADGTVDPAFSIGGRFSMPIFDVNIGLQSDGKIIWTTGMLINGIGTEIKRLLSDGTLDVSFPNIAEPEMNSSDLLVLPNNDFLIGGSQSGKFALAKYSAEGVKQGITNLTDFGGSACVGKALAVQADGKILFAGSTSDQAGYDFAIARFMADGAIDNSFGNAGKSITNFSNLDNAEGVVVQADGKIIVAGWRENTATDTVFASARYLSNGQLDPCYGLTGRLEIDLPASLNNAVGLQSDGKIVFAGVSGYPDRDFALARYVATAQPTNWYRDFDGDGYGNDATFLISCPQPLSELVKLDPNCVEIIPFIYCQTKIVHWVSQGGDCDDNYFASHPGAVEICDGKDNNCDGQIDEGLPTTTYYVDEDDDGYGGGAGLEFCNNPGIDYVTTGGDCNDNDPNIHPGPSLSLEVCDGIDNNCNGVIDEGCSGKPTISISNSTVYESEGVAVLTVKLSFITSLQLKINYATSPGTAVSNKNEKDYKSIGNTMLTIPPGTLSTTITVPIYSDNKVENNEYFYVVLSKPTNCILGNVTGVVTILDGAPLNPVTSNKSTLPMPLSEKTEVKFNAVVYPNPSAKGFTLDLSVDDHLPVLVNIRNAIGQVIQSFRPVNNRLRFGQELKAGFYFVQVQQGNRSKTIKLVKY